MKIYIVIQMSDCELISVMAFKEELKANESFEEICIEEGLVEHEDFSREMRGTIRIAGDDAWSVQIIRKELL